MKRTSSPKHAYSPASNDNKPRSGIGRIAVIAAAALLAATTVQAFTVIPRNLTPPEFDGPFANLPGAVVVFPCHEWPQDNDTSAPIALAGDIARN